MAREEQVEDLIEELQERIDNPEVVSDGGGGMCYVDRDLLRKVVAALRKG